MPDDPPWGTIQLAAALVAHRRIDLLHAHLPKAHLLAGLVGRLTDRPVLCTVHGWHLSTQDLEVHRATGSHLSVVCRQSYFHALGLGVEPERLSCDPNGVDTNVFQPRPRGGAGLRAALKLAPDAPLVGFVGRLSPEKGPEVLVRAALLLRSRLPQAQTVFVGEGPMGAELQTLIRRLQLQRHVHLVGLRRDMPVVYAEFDVSVSCSHSEAMPLALMEAMACGVPTVATRVGGVPDIVEHGQTGWLVAPDDFDDIAGRVAALLEDPAARLRMGRRARIRAVERLNLDASVDRVAALIGRLARPKTAASLLPPRRTPAVPAHPPMMPSASAPAAGDGRGIGNDIGQADNAALQSPRGRSAAMRNGANGANGSG